MRDKLWREHKRFPNNLVITERFRKYRNYYREVIRKAGVDYFRRNVGLSNDPKESWRIINEQLRSMAVAKKLPTVLSRSNPKLDDLNKANQFYAQVSKRVNEQVGYKAADGISG